jgi:hypothetical protein
MCPFQVGASVLPIGFTIALLVAVVVALIAIAGVDARARLAAPGTERVNLEAVQAFARRTRTIGLILLLLYPAFVVGAARLFTTITYGRLMLLLVVCWSLAIITYVAATTLRAHVALSGEHATATGDLVFVWRGRRVRTWLRVRRHKLAALGVPEARVRR